MTMGLNKRKRKFELKFGCFFGFIFIHFFSCLHCQIYFQGNTLYNPDNIVYVETSELIKAENTIYVSSDVVIFDHDFENSHVTDHLQKPTLKSGKISTKNRLKNSSKTNKKPEKEYNDQSSSFFIKVSECNYTRHALSPYYRSVNTHNETKFDTLSKRLFEDYRLKTHFHFIKKYYVNSKNKGAILFLKTLFSRPPPILYS